jgi:hypothetical protein
MRTGTFYLNNTGHRWVNLTNGKKDQIFAYINGELIKRTAIYYESFGNFACACISYKGKKYSILRFSHSPDKLSPQVDNVVLQTL